MLALYSIIRPGGCALHLSYTCRSTHCFHSAQGIFLHAKLVQLCALSLLLLLCRLGQCADPYPWAHVCHAGIMHFCPSRTVFVRGAQGHSGRPRSCFAVLCAVQVRFLVRYDYGLLRPDSCRSNTQARSSDTAGHECLCACNCLCLSLCLGICDSVTTMFPHHPQDHFYLLFSGIHTEAGAFLSVSATVALSTRGRQHSTSTATAQTQFGRSAQQQIYSAAYVSVLLQTRGVLDR